jgi:hypothetical protein
MLSPWVYLRMPSAWRQDVSGRAVGCHFICGMGCMSPRPWWFPAAVMGLFNMWHTGPMELGLASSTTKLGCS